VWDVGVRILIYLTLEIFCGSSVHLFCGNGALLENQIEKMRLFIGCWSLSIEVSYPSRRFI